MTARPADCASSPHLACAAYVCRWQVCGAQKLPTWRHRLLNGGEEGPLQEYFEQAANGAYGDTPPLSWNSPRNSTLWASIAIEHLAWPRTMQVPRPLLAWSSRKRRPRSRRAKKEVGGWLGVLPHDGRWLHRMVARAATSVSSWALGAVGSACTITRMPGTHFSSDGSCGLFHPRRGPPPPLSKANRMPPAPECGNSPSPPHTPGLVSTGMSSLPHLSRIAGGSLKPRRALPGRRRRRALNASTVSRHSPHSKHNYMEYFQTHLIAPCTAGLPPYFLTPPIPPPFPSSAKMTCSLSLLAGPIPPSTLERASVSPISSSTSIRLATARTRCSTLRLASARFRQQRGLPRHLTMTGMGIRSGRHLCTCTLFGSHSL